jgi:Uma2 family endonuclease
MPSVPPDIAAWRKRTGADRWDEMWDGVLHMPPMPNRAQQELEAALETFLRSAWAPLRQAKVYHQINVAAIGGWPNNYRIPDLVVLLPQRFAIDRNEYFEGAPDVVVEIHSPGAETYEKLPFYAELGVPEVWVIHRDTRVPELYALRGKRYRKRPAGAGGWLRSPGTGVELAPGRQAGRAARRRRRHPPRPAGKLKQTGVEVGVLALGHGASRSTCHPPGTRR